MSIIEMAAEVVGGAVKGGVEAATGAKTGKPGARVKSSGGSISDKKGRRPGGVKRPGQRSTGVKGGVDAIRGSRKVYGSKKSILLIGGALVLAMAALSRKKVF